MTIPTTRVRTRKPKTRTGCRTCKIRRIKCDEQRPSCLKCSSTGRHCDGYEVAPGASKLASICAIDATGRTLIQRDPEKALQVSPTLGMTSDESQGWDFFRTKTVREIRGCFQSNLWEHLILQISHQEPAILHASIALGSMHRKFKESGVSTAVLRLNDPCQVFSLRQYVKAIGSLRKRLNSTGDSQTRDVSLITCLLFICLEMIQGQRLGALTHLQTGLRILSGSEVLKNDKSSEPRRQLVLKHDPDILIDQLTEVFARMDYNSTMFGLPSPHLRLVPEQSVGKPFAWVPATFFNIQEARQFLDSLSSAVFRFRGDLLEISTTLVTDPTLDAAAVIVWQHATARNLDLSNYPTILSQHRAIQGGLAVWLSALDAYKDRSSSLFCHQDSKAIILLEIQHFYASFLMSNCQTTKEMNCDSFNSDFKRIIDLATSYFKDKSPKDVMAEPLSHSFTLEPGVIPSLYLIAMKCRDPIMRRQAILMISHATCQEGMWEGSLIARYVEQIADSEETAACTIEPPLGSRDIPEFARFSDVVLALSENPGHGRLICARYRHEIDGELYVWEETFALKK